MRQMIGLSSDPHPLPHVREGEQYLALLHEANHPNLCPLPPKEGEEIIRISLFAVFSKSKIVFSSNQTRGENLLRVRHSLVCLDRAPRASIFADPCREPQAAHRALRKRAALSAKYPVLLSKCYSS